MNNPDVRDGYRLQFRLIEKIIKWAEPITIMFMGKFFISHIISIVCFQSTL